MNEMSLRNKLLLFVTAILLFSSVITTLFLWAALGSANEAIVSKTKNALSDEVGHSLAGQTGLYGERIATFIIKPTVYPKSLMASSNKPTSRVSRPQVDNSSRSYCTALSAKKPRSVPSMHNLKTMVIWIKTPSGSKVPAIRLLTREHWRSIFSATLMAPLASRRLKKRPAMANMMKHSMSLAFAMANGTSAPKRS